MTFNIGVVHVVAFGLSISFFEATMFNLGMLLNGACVRIAFEFNLSFI